MSTHQTAKTQYASTDRGTRYAYRRLGTGFGTPLLILTHFRGVMDKFDPLLVNTLAATRSVILVDYAGAGLSLPGEVAMTVKQSADDIIEFLGMIQEAEVDILGFSLGGMVAQLVALNADPAVLKVRKLILAGTQSSGGEGVLQSPNAEDVNLHAGAKDITIETFQTLFFPKIKEGKVASEQWWARIHERSALTSGEEGEPATWLSNGYLDGAVGLQAQSAQLASFGNPETSQGLEGSLLRLGELRMPVLVANGHVSSAVWSQSRPSTPYTTE